MQKRPVIRRTSVYEIVLKIGKWIGWKLDRMIRWFQLKKREIK